VISGAVTSNDIAAIPMTAKATLVFEITTNSIL